MSTGSVEDQGSTSVPTETCRHGSSEEAPQVHGYGTGNMLLAQPTQWRVSIANPNWFKHGKTKLIWVEKEIGSHQGSREVIAFVVEHKNISRHFTRNGLWVNLLISGACLVHFTDPCETGFTKGACWDLPPGSLKRKGAAVRITIFFRPTWIEGKTQKKKL